MSGQDDLAVKARFNIESFELETVLLPPITDEAVDDDTEGEEVMFRDIETRIQKLLLNGIFLALSLTEFANVLRDVFVGVEFGSGTFLVFS